MLQTLIKGSKLEIYTAQQNRKRVNYDQSLLDGRHHGLELSWSADHHSFFVYPSRQCIVHARTTSWKVWKWLPQQTKGHRKKYQNEDFAKNGRKNFRSYTMMRKRRKCFALFARKQREKFHLQVVDASTSNNQCSKSMQRTMATKCAIVWETCLGIWNKTVFFIVILDSKYSKMTPKFVKQKSHWLHSSIKLANPVSSKFQIVLNFSHG